MISIIIPVLNEEKNIYHLLKELHTLKGDKEIIVADGGSEDQTREIASKYATVISSGKGRGLQMNKGASIARGEGLWFLHSDSVIVGDAIQQIENTIKEGYIGGGFSLYFHDYPTAFMKFVSITSNWRAKYLGLYYGDQGIFIKKEVFHHIGGYPEIAIMEDWEIGKKLREIGKMKMLQSPIGTSGRRFKQGGQLKTLLLMHKIKVLYTLGVAPAKLVKIYREAR
ncbi:TIGR04283 family arsenosugar biosynthesis glycosyltransferase [Natronincola ferrireducens]|uniref:4,4'-diaponeurosporenoate glycosyltransferase n=1 Tax=Natronincola ferrireducens TaxID=393762 RepID=A0A1G9EHH4_9FIRM|nr:TIGR04283 family arsenosugar biosynthesis glycosyltransferase [Natronincola ferrireducens]SDK75592.1 transferase 2, rSAM/selenodomain-associated [Natronincola ferrireducens]